MKRNNLIRLFFGVLVICLCLSSTPTAAQLVREEATLSQELRALSASVDQLTLQMAKQSDVENQDTKLRKLDIAIAYLNFRSRRIEMFERDLQSVRTSRNRLNDLLERFQREKEELSQTFDIDQQKASEELNFRRQVVIDRVSRMDEEVILLENRIMDMRGQIDSVESFVQKNLEF